MSCYKYDINHRWFGENAQCDVAVHAADALYDANYQCRVRLLDLDDLSGINNRAVHEKTSGYIWRHGELSPTGRSDAYTTCVGVAWCTINDVKHIRVVGDRLPRYHNGYSHSVDHPFDLTHGMAEEQPVRAVYGRLIDRTIKAIATCHLTTGSAKTLAMAGALHELAHAPYNRAAWSMLNDMAIDEDDEHLADDCLDAITVIDAIDKCGWRVGNRLGPASVAIDTFSGSPSYVFVLNSDHHGFQVPEAVLPDYLFYHLSGYVHIGRFDRSTVKAYISLSRAMVELCRAVLKTHEDDE